MDPMDFAPTLREPDPAELAEHEEAQKPPPGVPPEPLPLVLLGSDEPLGYACPLCRMLFSGDAKASRQAAQDHCRRQCADCNVRLDPKRRPYWLICEGCEKARREKKERDAFEKATKLAYEAYDGQTFYCEGIGDEFFEDLTDLREAALDAGKDCPAYVWACKPKSLHIDAGGIVGQALDDHHEDAGDSIPDSAYASLQAFLDDWCKARNITTYEPDYSRAILVPAAEGEE